MKPDAKALRRFEDVWVTELLDGIAVVFSQTWLSSATIRSRAADHPWIADFCKTNPTLTVHAVNYGSPQFNYGLLRGKTGLAVYGLHDGQRWLNANDARTVGYTLHWVPTILVAPYTDEILKMASGPTA